MLLLWLGIACCNLANLKNVGFSGPGQRVDQSIFFARRLFQIRVFTIEKRTQGPMCARATYAGGHARPQRRCNTQNHDTPPHKHTHALPTDTSTHSNNTTHTQESKQPSSPEPYKNSSLRSHVTNWKRRAIAAPLLFLFL